MSLLQQAVISRRGFIEDATTDLNFYLLVLGALSATGGVILGTLKWWQVLRSTYRLGFRPAEATNEDVEMIGAIADENPTVHAALASGANHSNVPGFKEAAQNIKRATSRQSSPASRGSSLASRGASPARRGASPAHRGASPASSSGSGGEGPSATAWKDWGKDSKGDRFRHRRVGGTDQYQRWSKLKKEWSASSGPRTST